MTLEQLEELYAEKVRNLQEMKERGNLTKDWGESSLICTRIFLSAIRDVLAAARASDEQPNKEISK